MRWEETIKRIAPSVERYHTLLREAEPAAWGSPLEDREREKGQLEQERRMLQAEHQRCRGEARRLPSAALDERVVQIETRLGDLYQRDP